jgi:uncharacterized protein (TIGR00369 family)
VTSVPEGYEPLAQTSPFNQQLGTHYARTDSAGRRWRGIRIVETHCNNMGVVHGGLYMSLADNLLGNAIARRTESATLTIRMTADFLSTARVGDWLEGYAEVEAVTDGIAYATAGLYVAERLVFTASAVFKIMRPRGARV